MQVEDRKGVFQGGESRWVHARLGGCDQDRALVLDPNLGPRSLGAALCYLDLCYLLGAPIETAARLPKVREIN